MLVSGVWPEGSTNAGLDAGITNAVVRNALNLSAWYPSFSTWDPSAGTMPISPVAPCTQVGWGVVNMSNIQPMIEHLNGSQSMPDRPGDVELCMQVNLEAREAYWGVYPSEEAPSRTLEIAARD